VAVSCRRSPLHWRWESFCVPVEFLFPALCDDLKARIRHQEDPDPAPNMTGILDQMTARRRVTSFRPTTARELFVLRLAQKLGEPAAAEHYAELARRHSDETLLLAYRRALNHGPRPLDLARNIGIRHLHG